MCPKTEKFPSTSSSRVHLSGHVSKSRESFVWMRTGFRKQKEGNVPERTLNTDEHKLKAELVHECLDRWEIDTLAEAWRQWLLWLPPVKARSSG